MSRDHHDDQHRDDQHRDGTAATARVPQPSPGRGARLGTALRRVGITSAWVLLIAAVVALLGWLLGRVWQVILLPLVLALLVSTVLWPATRFLRSHRWPPALAALTMLVAFLALLAGLVVLVVPPVVQQAASVADQASAGLGKLQEWLTGPPLNLGRDQVGQAVDAAINTLRNNARNIAGYVLGWIGTIGSWVVNAVLAVVLTFFFLKDGPRWTPWLAAQTGPRAAPHVATLSQQAWQTLSEFIRQQILIGMVDAVGIGLGLWLLGVPLVLPLSVLTFLGAFVPILGAFVAGLFAVLIALVSNGFTTALIVLGVVLLVQQLEGNVLTPIIQGRGLHLHSAVVILAVSAGGTLFGIAGAFLAVPVAALVAVVYRYARDELDGRDPEVAEDGSRFKLVGNSAGTALIRDEPAPAARSNPASSERSVVPGGAHVHDVRPGDET